MKKASEYRYLEALKLSNGRRERIRTFDPLHPMQVRYQAALHAETSIIAMLMHNSIKQAAYLEQFLSKQL